MKGREKAIVKQAGARFDETRRKNGGKAVSLYDLEWKLIQNFPSARACAMHVGTDASNVTDIIKTKGILMEQYRVSYVKKERPDISKAKRI